MKRGVAKMSLTVLGLADAMGVCLLDSYGLIGNIAIITVAITTAIGMPLFAWYIRKYHKSWLKEY